MDRESFSLHKLAVDYLCLYAVLYPLLAHFLMNESGTGGVGSTPVQALQFLTLVACLYVGKFGKSSVRESVDVWIVGSIYFGCAALYLATFFAEDERFVEITYAARFIMWFLFAAIVVRGSFGIRQLEKLSFSFLLGTFFQGLLAIWAFKTQNVGSIYKEVYATTGGAYVSGKMIVSFVTLGIFLASYWLMTSLRSRWFFSLSIFVGFLVILFSYNRATQLSLTIVVLLDGFWLFRNKKIKAVFLLAIIAILIGAFLSSSAGDSFLLRWQNIQDDGGSGRVKLVRAAVKNIIEPDSMSTLLFGKGYHQTKLIMYQACGAFIGAHSDFFDFLTVYGLVGGAFYLWIVLKILTMNHDLPSGSPEYLCIRSSGVFIIIAGLFTGLFQGTYTFFMLFTLCRYWYEMGRRRAMLQARPYADGGFGFFPSQEGWGTGNFLPEALVRSGAEYLPNGYGERRERWETVDEEWTDGESFQTESEQGVLETGEETVTEDVVPGDNSVRNEASNFKKDASETSGSFQERIKYLDQFFGQGGAQENFWK